MPHRDIAMSFRCLVVVIHNIGLPPLSTFLECDLMFSVLDSPFGLKGPLRTFCPHVKFPDCELPGSVTPHERTRRTAPSCCGNVYPSFGTALVTECRFELGRFPYPPPGLLKQVTFPLHSTQSKATLLSLKVLRRRST